MIEIKSRSGDVLYVSESARNQREAVEEAVRDEVDLQHADLQGANLRDADLRYAYLQHANLRYAYLRAAKLQGAYPQYADLRRADLQGADLQGAYLQGAYLQRADLRYAYLQHADFQGANLRDADLGDANDPRHPLHVIRADTWSILDRAPEEVEALRKAMIEGRINGSVYCDESGCGCLCGTIGIARAGGPLDKKSLADALAELGIERDGFRPAEQWVLPIGKGDKPLPLDTAEWPSESVFRLSHLAAWVDEWVESRSAGEEVA